ncbi:MAG TPA: Zn-dependent alcohol dehydrogenase [Usitatibacter sp.]|nr:Zn-dependent alcohol dehydrogenase [Usitatibacter sp.]
MRFRAAVLHAGERRLAIEEVELPAPGPGEVLVRNHASGLCHTDLEVMEGQIAYPRPIVLGHEGAGVVEAVGRGVTSVRPGDSVIASWNPSCGHCFYCEHDQPVLCEPFRRHQPAGRMLDGSTRLTLRGEPLHHFGVVSSHAEYSMLPEAGAVTIPPEMPLDRACVIGCGVMTGVGAVARLTRPEPGSCIAVVGCGAVGLNAVQGAVIARAGSIVAIDRDAARLDRAREFGATHAIPADANAVDVVRSLTRGRGADAVFESAGAESAMQLAIEIARPGGQVVILGKVQVDRQVAFRFGSLMGEKRITRSSYGGARPARDFPWLARLYLEGKLRLDELVTARLPLERINDGFDAMRRGEGVRTVVSLA